ncbi:MAG: DUF362 domain-containing protein [Candidatus Omnitrophica bacterium]|nr:DUF362 domain-containing protein [Candidatus Omnitrophota bacterium]
MKSRVAILSCNKYVYEDVYDTLKKALSILGGIESFVKPKSRVLLKPNLLMAISPEKAVTTHPQLVKAVVRILKDIDCHIYLGDSPSVWFKVDLQEVFEKCGMRKIAEEEGIELVDFNHPIWKENFPLTKWLEICDCFISLPKFKTHTFTILSGAIKNLFGLISGMYKAELHRRYPKQKDFCKVLVDLYAVVKPHLSLTIVDGIVALQGDGPATEGIPKSTNFILIGADAVAIDSILALITGLNPLHILTTQEAKERRLGIADLKDIEILGDNLLSFIDRDFKLPRTSWVNRVPSPFLDIAKLMMRFYPKIKQLNCLQCGLCTEICPVGAMRIKNKKVVIDYAKCISCFCCQEACLYSAIKIKKSLLAKIIGV